MPATQKIKIVHCHAEGEVGDVIVSGVKPPPGETLWEQSRWIAADGALRDYVLNEPRGGVFRHVNLLTPPKNPAAQMGFIIMEPEDTPPMSGSNSICVATVLLESGMAPMREPVTELTLESPGGLVAVYAECEKGKVRRVTVENHPSFVDKRDVQIDVPGVGSFNVDTAYGGDSFVIVDASDIGLELEPKNARALAEFGVRISDAATKQLGFHHPGNPDWRHVSFCLFKERAVKRDGVFETRHTVAIRPGKIDRSPTGTGVCAHMALLQAKGEMKAGDKMLARSIIDSEFTGAIVGETSVGDVVAIRPTITGRAWIYGETTWRLDPDDPWPKGYRLADTWPRL